MKSRLLVLVLLLFMISITGCVRVDFGRSTPTIGEQLFDLTRAYESGSLTEDEFRELRRKVMRSLLHSC